MFPTLLAAATKAVPTSVPSIPAEIKQQLLNYQLSHKPFWPQTTLG
jgi:hypothetical protein